MKTINEGLVVSYIPWGVIDDIEPVTIGVVGLEALAAKDANEKQLAETDYRVRGNDTDVKNENDRYPWRFKEHVTAVNNNEAVKKAKKLAEQKRQNRGRARR